MDTMTHEIVESTETQKTIKINKSIDVQIDESTEKNFLNKSCDIYVLYGLMQCKLENKL